MSSRRITATIVAVAVGLLGLLVPIPTAAAALPDTWYAYDGAKPLADYQAGDVLKTRTFPAKVFALPTEVTAIQILYRSTDVLGRPTANATTLLVPPGEVRTDRVMSYQSFYDSMNPDDAPSRYIHGDITIGGLVNVPEGVAAAAALTHQTMVVVPDTEGQKADFSVGPVYGMNTLDSIRAIRRSRAGGLDADAKVGLIGYSGGAIATSWAAALAPSYAPDVNRDIVGATEGGLLVTPAHNLRYISGSLMWSGVAAMAIVGLSRAFGISMDPYLSDYARTILPKFETAAIAGVLLEHPWLKWEHMVKPEYADPNSIKEFVEVANKVNLGSAPTPSVPVMIMQGNGGWVEGTGGNIKGIGPGDGVMVAGDVRSLARQYCDDGLSVQYDEIPLSHVGTALVWAYPAYMWLKDRFDGLPAPSNCTEVTTGNSLAPEIYRAPNLPGPLAPPAAQHGVQTEPEPTYTLGPAPRTPGSVAGPTVGTPRAVKLTPAQKRKLKKKSRKHRRAVVRR